MPQHAILYPRQPVPDLAVPTVDGGEWRLADRSPDAFTMVVFYRGLHCPICSRYLADLNRRLSDFAERGVDVIVLSTDDEERATRESWSVDSLTLGYGLTLAQARSWGLFVSTSRGKTSAGVVEPDLFAEPAVYLIRPDGTLYFGTVQTMPFARPSFREILGAIDWVLENDYPARGEVVDDALPSSAGVGAAGADGDMP